MKKPHTLLQALIIVTMLLMFTVTLPAQETSHITRDSLLKKLGHLYTESVSLYGRDYEKMLDVALEAEKLYYNIKPEPAEQFYKIFNVIGVAYQSTGDYDQSISYLQKWEDYLKRTDKKERLGGAMMNLGLSYNAQGETEAAIEQYLKALPLIAEYQNNKLSSLYNSLGNGYRNIGAYDLSEKYHRKSLVLKLKIHQGIHDHIATSYFNLGALYIVENKYKAAKACLDTCLEMRLKLGIEDGVDLSNTYYKIGLTYRERSLHQDAILAFQESIKALVPSYDTPSVESQPNLDSTTLSRLQLLYPLMAKAKTLHRIYQQTEALEDREAARLTFQTAVALIDKIRGTYHSEGSKQDLMNLAKSCYEGAIKHALFAYEQTGEALLLEEAFRLTERSKAMILNEAIKEAAVKYSSLPDSLLKKETTLKKDIASLEHQLSMFDEKEKESDKAKDLRRSIFTSKKELAQLIEEIERNYYTDTQVKIASIVGVQDSIIDEKTILVEYFLSDSSLFIFAISKEEIFVKSEKIDTSLLQRIDSLQNFISKIPTENELVLKQKYKQQAFELYQQLFPFLSKFKARQLLLIPDAQLGYLPFETLLTDDSNFNKSVNYNRLPYLMNSYDIRYEYSASTLLNKTQKQKTTKNYLGIAPSFDQKKGLWRSIPSSIEEVQTIAQIIEGDYLINETAQKSTFLQSVLDYNILHLATHAFSNHKNPLHQSAFVFAAKHGDRDSLIHEYLYAYELYQMQINADLAVLSACDTGTGKLEDGEGIMSLARAFKYAGCSNIVTSLWPANDKVTKTIMVDFFKNLKGDMGKTSALQEAKKTYLEHPIADRTHPSFWATFILIGDDKPIELPESSSSYYWWGIAFVSGCLGILWWKK